MKRLAPLLVLFAFFCACHKDAETGIPIQSEVKRLVPANAQALAGIDLAATRSTPLYARYGNTLNVPLMEESARSLGLDPRRNLNTLLVAFFGSDTVAVANGTFARADLQRKLEAHGAKPERSGAATLFENGSSAVLFPRDGLAVAGSAAAVRASVRERNNSGAGIPEKLAARLRLLPADDQVWFVSTGAIPLGRLSNASGMLSTFSSLASFINASSVGLHIDAGLHLRADLSCISENGAQQVRDAVRGLIGFARLTTREGDLPLLKVYDAVNVQQQGSTVRIRAELSPELSQTLCERIPQWRGTLGAAAR